MNKAMVLGSAILLMALVIGCGSTSPEDKVMQEMIATMKQMAELKEQGAKDPAAANKALELMTKMLELGKKIESWPKEKQIEMQKKYEGEMKALEARMK